MTTSETLRILGTDPTGTRETTALYGYWPKDHPKTPRWGRVDSWAILCTVPGAVGPFRARRRVTYDPWETDPNDPEVPAYLSDEWLNRHELALVYYSGERWAHLMQHRFVNVSSPEPPICGKERLAELTPYGTGTQDEWERARALPLCRGCRSTTEGRR